MTRGNSSCLVVAGLLLARALALAAPQDGAMPAAPAAAQLPGITTEDPTPHACVDCHVRSVERDMRLSALVSALAGGVPDALLAKAQAAAPEGVTLQGWHPDVEVAADIPGKCMRCHRRSSEKAPPFSRLLHSIHLAGGEDSRFLKEAQGTCTSCHKLDKKTGQWRVPSAPEK
jgi:cytochrome c553